MKVADRDEVTLKANTVPVSDTEPGSEHAPEDPTREGYIFTGRERHDINGDEYVTLNSDGSVTDVTGPGPIIYIATYRKIPAGSLTVRKTISGNAADPNKAFDFTVILGDTAINGTYGDMSFTNGVAAFSLRGDESVTAAELPIGISYTVTEADYSAEGYTTTGSGDTGVIPERKTLSAEFTNTGSIVPVTGDDNNVLLWSGVMGITFLGMLGTLSGNKRRRGAH